MKCLRKCLLYGHGGAYNHGAEAILRTSVPIFRQLGIPIFLSTHFPAQDREFGLDKLVDRLIPADLSLVAKEKTQTCFQAKEKIAAEIYRDALSQIDSETICIGIGGDNYCYPNWHRQSIFHHTVKKHEGRSILWGCSIQSEMIDEHMGKILQEHDHIYVRENLTRQALHKHKIHQLTCLPDPAFLLEPKPVSLPEGFGENTVAINLSPLILRRSKDLMQYFIETAQLLLKKVDSLLFIPHVTMPMDNDEEVLTILEESLTSQECRRICWASHHLNAAQRKYLISQCKMLICCRTHASIAGYSTSVPTLVVGYSVKSQGIGMDLNMQNWVISAGQGEQLARLALQLWNSHDTVRQTLYRQNEHIMKQYEKLMDAGGIVCYKRL